MQGRLQIQFWLVGVDHNQEPIYLANEAFGLPRHRWRGPSHISGRMPDKILMRRHFADVLIYLFPLETVQSSPGSQLQYDVSLRLEKIDRTILRAFSGQIGMLPSLWTGEIFVTKS